MSSCCPLCSSANQLSIDSATLCMECATVATPVFTILTFPPKSSPARVIVSGVI